MARIHEALHFAQKLENLREQMAFFVFHLGIRKLKRYVISPVRLYLHLGRRRHVFVSSAVLNDVQHSAHPALCVCYFLEYLFASFFFIFRLVPQRIVLIADAMPSAMPGACTLFVELIIAPISYMCHGLLRRHEQRVLLVGV